MSVAKVIKIVASSDQSLQHAIENGVERASASLRGVHGVKVCDVTMDVEGNRISRYNVTLEVAFSLESPE